jgi:hypothetical protein
MRAFCCGILLMIIAVLGPGQSLAHHSHASLNSDDVRLYQGVVTRYSWRAPHIFFQADVVAQDGSVKNYTVEALNPSAMKALGWNKDSFAVGDLITWEGPHDKDKERPFAGVNWADTPAGIRLLSTAEATREVRRSLAAELANTPVEAVTEIGRGSWVRIAPDGGPHPFIREPATDWPLTAAAQEDVDSFSEDDTPINQCIFGGPPRNIVSLSNFNWSKPNSQRIVIDRDMWASPRVIHLADAPPRGAPSSFGYSTGYFDGDELIVETDNFAAETWGMYTGIDSTEQKTLRERYWLSEAGMRLNVKFTVTDPGVLTEPYSYTHQWKRVPDRELVKAPCTLESAWLYKTAGYSDVVGVDPDSVAASAESTENETSTVIAIEPEPSDRRLLWWLVLGGLIIGVITMVRRLGNR